MFSDQKAHIECIYVVSSKTEIIQLSDSTSLKKKYFDICTAITNTSNSVAGIYM